MRRVLAVRTFLKASGRKSMDLFLENELGGRTGIGSFSGAEYCEMPLMDLFLSDEEEPYKKSTSCYRSILDVSREPLGR